MLLVNYTHHHYSSILFIKSFEKDVHSEKSVLSKIRPLFTLHTGNRGCFQRKGSCIMRTLHNTELGRGGGGGVDSKHDTFPDSFFSHNYIGSIIGPI